MNKAVAKECGVSDNDNSISKKKSSIPLELLLCLTVPQHIAFLGRGLDKCQKQQYSHLFTQQMLYRLNLSECYILPPLPTTARRKINFSHFGSLSSHECKTLSFATMEKWSKYVSCYEAGYQLFPLQD